ncbi:hypothetical protein [Bosea sp. 124]|uniref:hypothetical protein n=1 Tax=Bosea sp. 124 TaxID=2135642 RepID=UPI000D442B15|nr:hypothetical protein [Bosea sp. 124]PTM39385.1 hypothetical protein C8D03_0876 [Bosea sp. 124]
MSSTHESLLISTTRKVVIIKDGSVEPVFIWVGVTSSREAASTAALEAMRSVFYFSTGIENNNTQNWLSNLRININTEWEETYYIPPDTTVEWQIGPRMSMCIDEYIAARFSNFDNQEITSIVECVIAEDSNYIKIPADSEFSLYISDAGYAGYKNISVVADHSIDGESHFCPLDDDTVFVLISLSFIFDLGNWHSPSMRKLDIVPAQSATLRAARRAMAPSLTQQAIAFLRKWGGDIAADRLEARARTS